MGWSGFGKKVKDPKTIRRSTGQEEPMEHEESEEMKKKRERYEAALSKRSGYSDEDAQEDVEEANKAMKFKRLRGYWKK